MADLEIGNVEAYVRELVAEYFGSETERDRYSDRGSLANNSNDMPASTQGNLVNNTGQSGEGSN